MNNRKSQLHCVGCQLLSRCETPRVWCASPCAGRVTAQSSSAVWAGSGSTGSPSRALQGDAVGKDGRRQLLLCLTRDTCGAWEPDFSCSQNIV